MHESTSRLLRVVVAATLISATPDGRATTYNNEIIQVTGQRLDDGVDWYVDDYYGYDDWELEDRSEPSDEGDREPAEEQQAECEAIKAKVDDRCNLSSPPLLITNGCGSEGSELVPDYLIINLVPVTALGPIFTDACNVHDICYGTYPADKTACDAMLYTNMVSFAKSDMSDFQWTVYQFHAVSQAYLYSNALQSPFLAGASGEAFDGAQADGACRYYSTKSREAGCTQ